MCKKPTTAVLLILLTVLLVLPCLLPKTGLTAEKRVLRIGVVHDNRPVVFQDEEGTFQGIAIDILNEVAKRENWQLQYIPGTLPECFQRLNTGKLDLMVALAWSAKRAQKYQFSKKTILNNWAQIYSNTPNRFNSILDLENRRIALMKKSIHSTVFRELVKKFNLKVTLLPVDSYEAALIEVNAGRADGALINRLFGVRRAEHYGLVKTPIIFNPIELRYLTPLNGDPGLLRAIDATLTELQAAPNSLYYQSIARWLSGSAQWTGFVWLKKALAIALILLVLTCCAIVYSRWQIREKTKSLHKLLKEETGLRRTLIASEEKFRLAFITNPDAITISTMDGRYVEVNEGFCQILGYLPEDAIGKTSLELAVWHNPADREWLQNTLREKGRFRNMETKFVCKNGDVLCGLLSANIVQINNEPHILSITRDITERVTGEKERRLLARAIEQSSDTVIITDALGNIQYVNPAFEYHSGYDRTEALGNNPRMLQSGNHCQAFYQELWETILAGKTWQGYLSNKRKDGSLFQENATISPIKDRDGQIANFVAVKQDVTHERELEQQLQQAQKLEAIGTLAGGIAHDFNNILGAILGYAEMAKLALPEKSAAEEDLNEVITAGKRAVELVKQILTFSRQNSDIFQTVHLQSVIEETVKLLKASLPSTVHLQQNIDSSCAPVLGDPTQLHQVILNLCTNAKHALADEKGTISISLQQKAAPPPKEPARTGRILESPYLELTISDDGCGMDQQTMDRIFDPFFTTKAKDLGTGLGLSVSHGIIQQHSGSITVTSHPEEGSYFRILLPTITTVAESVQDAPKKSLPLGTERIVLVDDEKFLVNIVERALTQLGYSVIPFTDSSAALNWMRHHLNAFDLLLTDMTMPDVTGADLVRSLIALRPDIPIVICTGFSETLTKEQALTLGVKAYLPKPITKQQLATILHGILHP